MVLEDVESSCRSRTDVVFVVDQRAADCQNDIILVSVSLPRGRIFSEILNQAVG